MSTKPLSATVYTPIDDDSIYELDRIRIRDTTHHDDAEHAHCADWRPSLFHSGPVLGIAALLFSLLNIPACFIILQASSNHPIDSWRYYPTVYIGALTAISNKAITFAAIEGLVVYWWTQALKGTTFERLHKDWKMGSGLRGALTAGKQVNLIAAACILATLTAVDGPLLQRAITVVPQVLESSVTLSVLLSPEIPTNFTGMYYVQDAVQGDGNFSDPVMSMDFVPIFSDHVSGNPMQGAIAGCPGTCTTTVRGPALSLSHCNSSQEYQDYWAPIPENGLSRLFGDDILSKKYVFNVLLNSIPGDIEQIMLRVGLAEQSVAQNCTGVYTVTDCYYSPVIAEYPVVVDKIGTIDFTAPTGNPKVLEVANNTGNDVTALAAIPRDRITSINTTLSGIAAGALQQYTVTFGLVSLENGKPPILAGELETFSFQQMLNYDQWLQRHICIPHWKDPTDQIVAGLNEMMFRTGIQAAKMLSPEELQERIDVDLQTTYNVQGVRTDPVNVFKVHFWYFIAAVVIELAAIVVTSCTFYGWWRLGRAVSFSPLEIAKAFDAPGLGEIDPNMKADAIAETLGDRPLRYGAISDRRDVDGTADAKQVKLMFRFSSRSA